MARVQSRSCGNFCMPNRCTEAVVYAQQSSQGGLVATMRSDLVRDQEKGIILTNCTLSVQLITLRAL